MRVFRCDGYYQEAVHKHGLLCYGGIMSNRFKLYNVNMKYIRNLHHIDNNADYLLKLLEDSTKTYTFVADQ